MKEGWASRVLTGLENLGGEVNVPMSRWTTFRVGGSADLLVQPANATQFRLLLQRAAEEEVPVEVIGGGSNLIVRDGGIRGLVVVLGDQFAHTQLTPDGIVVATAGVRLTELSRLAADAGLSGLEFAAGIPGTLGGALVMNAGAFNGQIEDAILRVQILDELRESRWLSKSEMEFGYRESAIQKKPWWIVAAELKLTPGDKVEIKEKIQQFTQERRSKQPIQYPSAGSTFKRPHGHFAGQLIESCGLKGRRVGGAQVSELHAGFIINTGGATAGNILDLISLIQREVMQHHGVELELEVRIIGVD